MHCNLMEFPEEMITTIFAKTIMLNYKSGFNLRIVCKLFKNIIDKNFIVTKNLNDNLINLLSNFNPSEYELEIIQANSIIWCNIISIKYLDLYRSNSNSFVQNIFLLLEKNICLFQGISILKFIEGNDLYIEYFSSFLLSQNQFNAIFETIRAHISKSIESGKSNFEIKNSNIFIMIELYKELKDYIENNEEQEKICKFIASNNLAITTQQIKKLTKVSKVIDSIVESKLDFKDLSEDELKLMVNCRFNNTTFLHYLAEKCGSDPSYIGIFKKIISLGGNKLIQLTSQLNFGMTVPMTICSNNADQDIELLKFIEMKDLHSKLQEINSNTALDFAEAYDNDKKSEWLKCFK